MFCENCGKKIPDRAMFCPDCGNRLKENSKRKKKPLKWILFLVVVIILAVVARTALKDWNYKTKYPAGYAMNKLVKSGAWNPSYTDDTAMNNYLQLMNADVAFVCDGEDVYFQDNVNYYHLTDDDSIYYMPRYAMKDMDGNEIEEEGNHGIFINDILYSNTDGLMSYLDKDNNINVWRMEFKVSDHHYNVASEILPYDNSLYFVYDGTLYQCTYKNITAQSVSIENGINWFSTDKEAVVFDEAEVWKFGIYEDTIVMLSSDKSIWTLDISSGKAVCVLEGAKYRDQRCSVANGYIYYYFTDDSWNEAGSFTDNGKADYIGRVKFDGTDNNPRYFELVSGDNVFNMSDSYIYYLQYNRLYDEYFLIQTPIEDTTKQRVLATGEEHGLDEMVYNLYVNDEWIYYVSTASGFWRAKIDGTLVEKLQEYNSEEKQEKNMIYPLKVEEYPSKFEIQQFTSAEESENAEEEFVEEEVQNAEASVDEESEQSVNEDLQDSNADTENPVAMETLEDGIYEYAEGEYISDLEIYEENGVKKAFLGFWHNYGDSASDEDFSFVWEDGKWKYQLIGNRSGEAFDLDITPEDSEHIHIKLTQSEWNGSYSWPSGNTTPVWLDTEFVKASE